MEELIDYCSSMTIDEILKLDDVAERVKLYYEQNELFKSMIRKYTTIDGNVIITDLRNVETIYTGNRFLIYSLYPKQNVSIWLVDGKNKQNCSFAVGYSIINKTCKSNIGSLMLKNNGGGHEKVGTCQVDYDSTDRILVELVLELKNNG